MVAFGRRAHNDGEAVAPVEDILTAELAASAQFQLAEPRGYYHAQVDRFVQMVVDTLRAREQQVLHLEQDKHDLRVENDQLQYDNQSLRAQIEVFRVQGSPLVDEQGGYVTESKLAGFDTAAMSREIDRVQSENAALLNQTLTQAATIAALEGELAELRLGGPNLTADAWVSTPELDIPVTPSAEAVPADATPAEPLFIEPYPAGLEPAVVDVDDRVGVTPTMPVFDSPELAPAEPLTEEAFPPPAPPYDAAAIAPWVPAPFDAGNGILADELAGADPDAADAAWLTDTGPAHAPEGSPVFWVNPDVWSVAGSGSD